MNIYNPFKPHIIQTGGTFAIRQLRFTKYMKFRWQYLHRENEWNIWEYCYTSIEMAEEEFANSKNIQKETKSIKFIKTLK